MLHDPALVKLGRPLQPVHDVRTLRFSAYVDKVVLPIPPAKIDYGNKITRWGMLGNDELGDCTMAGLLHMLMIFLSQNGLPVNFTKEDAVRLYSQFCGYVAGKPDTDQGGVLLDILKAWLKSPIMGVELLGFAAVNPTNWDHVQLAHYLGGSLYMGVNLPKEAQDETVWSSTTGTPGSWGGHCVVSDSYADRVGLSCSNYLDVITWGEKKKATPKWLAKYCDEIYVPITPAWFNKEGIAPNGFKMGEFRADVEAIQRAA